MYTSFLKAEKKKVRKDERKKKLSGMVFSSHWHEGNSEKRNSSGKIPGMFKENPSSQKPAEFEVFPSHSPALCSLKSLGLSINILNYSV